MTHTCQDKALLKRFEISGSVCEFVSWKSWDQQVQDVRNAFVLIFRTFSELLWEGANTICVFQMMRNVWWRKCSTTQWTVFQMKTRNSPRWGRLDSLTLFSHTSREGFINIHVVLPPDFEPSAATLLNLRKKNSPFSSKRRHLNNLNVNSSTHNVNTGFKHCAPVTLLCCVESHYENQTCRGNSWVNRCSMSNSKANYTRHFSTTSVGFFPLSFSGDDCCNLMNWWICTVYKP